MKSVVWTLLNFSGWLVETSTSQLKTTTCTTMKETGQGVQITCGVNELIYVNKQSMNYIGEISVVQNDNECRNTTASECFRSVPSDFVEDYTSFFNVSKVCNRKNYCNLGYNDFYRSASTFTESCRCCAGANFNLIRIVVYYECLPSEKEFSLGKNLTVILPERLYLTSRENGRCLLEGNVKSARILERANIDFKVRQKDTRLCTEISGNFDYNRDLPCLRDVSWFLLEIQTTDRVNGKLWIELTGTSLQIKCGENVQETPEFISAIPEFSDTADSKGFGLVPLIVGPIAGVLLLVLIIILLKLKLAKTRTPTKPVINATTILNENKKPEQHNNDAVYSEAGVGETQGSSAPFVETYYNTTDTDNYSQIDNIRRPGGSDVIRGERNGIGDTEGQDQGLISKGRDTTQPEGIVGELTGDVYASVCKQDTLTGKRIVGPKGDIYTTVSIPGN